MAMNPTGSIPTVTEGRFLILGGYMVFLNYLMNHHKAIRDKFQPLGKKNEIDKIMLWYQSILRISTQKLIRMIVAPKAFAEKPPLAEELQAQNDELYEVIIPILDKKLSKVEYICDTDDITICDLQIYNDIKSVLTL
mmetsp:Transcript_3613/g.3560  ORF Transcript_3613/g.3560 Transcript_3613/m.3560 type:complete len:137 (+) Transcript_3613:185-595(+)